MTAVARALKGENTPLWEMGYDEVEPWLVEDTSENRRRLRGDKLTWDEVYDEDGGTTSLLRVVTPEQRTARREDVWRRREDILSDRSDPWSDYLPAWQYPADFDAPYWVKDLIRRWAVDERAGKPESLRRPLPVRCEELRTDNTRCWNWTARTDGVLYCSSHLSRRAKAESLKPGVARRRVQDASLQAVEAVETLMDSAVSEPVRLKAALEILDRAGVRGGVEVDQRVTVEVVDAAREVRDRLERLAVRQLEARAAEAEREDVVDAEVVEETALAELQPTYEVMAPPPVTIPDEQP